MTSKELQEFLKKIAAQRRMLLKMGVSKRPVDNLDIVKVENAATFNNPTNWLLTNEELVYRVCPKQYRTRYEEIYKFLKT